MNYFPPFYFPGDGSGGSGGGAGGVSTSGNPLPWNELLLGPHYTLGLNAAVLGMLTIDSEVYADVPIIDKTRGEPADFGGTASLADIRPAARLRASWLADMSIDVASLRNATLRLHGVDWRIESFVALPSPDGEYAGEIGLILSEL